MVMKNKKCAAEKIYLSPMEEQQDRG